MARTWFDAPGVNRSVGDQSTLAKQAAGMSRAVKDAFLAAGWTCLGSCGSSDGTAGGLSANMLGVDTWTADTAIVWNTNGNPHSWFALSLALPTGKSIYMVLASSTGVPLMQLLASANALTGGTTSVHPTASGLAGIQNRLCSDAAGGPFPSYYHARATSSGDVFFAVSVRGTLNNIAQGFPGVLIFANVLSAYDPSTAYPWMLFANNTFTSPGAWNHASRLAANNGGLHAMFDNQRNNLIGATAGIGYFSRGGANIAGLWPVNGSPTGVQPSHPLWVTYGSSGAVLGRLTDIYAAPQQTGLYAEEAPDVAPSEWANVGGLWVPSGNHNWIMT